MHQQQIEQGCVATFKTLISQPENDEPGLFQEIQWELLALHKHLALLDDWVHRPYAKMFWQMDHLSIQELHGHYKQVLESGTCTSLIGYFDNRPVCQVELYDCVHDEIRHYYPASPHDIGLHFLMAPQSEQQIRGLSVKMMRSVLHQLLHCEGINRVMGEPDIRNQRANELVRKAGFEWVKQIAMSYKQANLYQCTLDTFNKIAKHEV